MFKVLIVDDEQIIRKGLMKIIEMNNNEFVVVGEARNGKEGFELAIKLIPDLVIADVKMPIVDGLQMLDNIKKILPDTKFIMLSAYTEYSYTRHALKSGVIDYLAKPVNRFELSALLDNIKNNNTNNNTENDCVDNNVEEATDNIRSERKVIEQAREYINSNFFNDISLDDVAKHIHMNPNYFSMLFKKEKGINFIEYLTGVRIEKAKQLLVTTDLKIYEVCQVVGYLSTKSFSKLFKDNVGMSPIEYKKMKN